MTDEAKRDYTPTPCWYVKDYADGWIKFYDPQMAMHEAEMTGANMRYSADGKPPQIYTERKAGVAPAGWVMVPVEPTEEMYAAGKREIDVCVSNGVKSVAAFCYSSMITAAPQHPEAGIPEPAEDDMSPLEAINSAIESFDAGELGGWELVLVKRRIEAEKATLKPECVDDKADLVKHIKMLGRNIKCGSDDEAHARYEAMALLVDELAALKPEGGRTKSKIGPRPVWTETMYEMEKRAADPGAEGK